MKFRSPILRAFPYFGLGFASLAQASNFYDYFPVTSHFVTSAGESFEVPTRLPGMHALSVVGSADWDMLNQEMSTQGVRPVRIPGTHRAVVYLNLLAIPDADNQRVTTDLAVTVLIDSPNQISTGKFDGPCAILTQETYALRFWTDSPAYVREDRELWGIPAQAGYFDLSLAKNGLEVAAGDSEGEFLNVKFSSHLIPAIPMTIANYLTSPFSPGPQSRTVLYLNGPIVLKPAGLGDQVRFNNNHSVGMYFKLIDFSPTAFQFSPNLDGAMVAPIR